MAIAFDSANGTVENPLSGTLDWTHTCSADATLLVVFTLFNGGTASSVTYNGTAMTLYDSWTPGQNFYIHYLENPDSGANTVSVSRSGGSSWVAGQSLSYEGAGAPDVVTNNNSVTTSLTTSLTTLSDNSWLAMQARAGSNGATNAGTGTTQRNNITGFTQSYDSNGAKSPTGSYSLQTTQASQGTFHHMIAIPPATVASTFTPKVMFF